MLVPKPLRAASGPCGSDIGQGATRRRCCPRVPGSPSPLAAAGSSAPAPPPPPHEAEMRKGGVCTEGPGTPEPGPAPSLPLGRSRFSPRGARTLHRCCHLAVTYPHRGPELPDLSVQPAALLVLL